MLFLSAAPRDQNDVDFDSVKGAIERAYLAQDESRRFSIHAVDGATRQMFRAALTRQPYDILHFSGHGRIDASGKGLLLLVDRRSGRTDEVPADQLCAALAGRGVRLVVLAACETASGNFNDDFSVTAEALVRTGVPAVVANQLPVTNRAMAAFMGPLYTELLRSGDIDRAVLEGRVALDFDHSSFEWGIPTLYRHAGASRLYRP